VALAIIAVVAGITCEIVFIGLADLISPRFLCSCSALGPGPPSRERPKWRLCMVPVYAAAALGMYGLQRTAGSWPWLARVGIIVAALYAVEAATGATIRKLTGRCPWDYSYSRWSVRGLVRLDFAPVWLLIAIAVDSQWSRLEALARAAARIFAG
jgi:hypothetical protein